MNFFEAFEKVKFTERRSVVKYKIFAAEPHLVEFFEGFVDENGVIEWPVRGLTLDDIGQLSVETDKIKTISSLFEGLAKAASIGNSTEVNNLAQEISGLKQETPAIVIRKYAMFELGTCEPCKPRNRQDTVKIANVAPMFFEKVIDAINLLTAQGQEAKKKPLNNTKNIKKT
jgi:hypothetical protein